MRRGAGLLVAAMLSLALAAGAQTWQETGQKAVQEAGAETGSRAAAQRGPVFRAEFSNPAIAPSRWTLVLYPDGTGHFHADRTNSTAPKPTTIEPMTVDRDVKLSPEFAAEVFATARRNHFFNEVCQSRQKVAFQGWKTLSYQGPYGEGSCRFNYSKEKDIESLGESLVGVASTLMEGARLELLREHEPLGLDREMGYIVDAAGDGRLQQISAIRGILKQLEADPSVMERVRRQARKLLAQADRGD